MYNFYVIRNNSEKNNLSYISVRRDSVNLAVWSTDLGIFSRSTVTREEAFDIFQRVRKKKNIVIKKERHYD